jgi:hypothetical protein
MRKLIFLIVPIILCFFTVAPSSCAKNVKTLNNVLSAYNASFGAAGILPVIKDFSHKARGIIFHTIIAQKNDTRIEIEIIKPLDKAEASRQIASKYQVIKNLYGPQTIPYPGAVTSKTDCPEDKKPVEKEIDFAGGPTKVLLANASERYILGVWDDALIKQKAAFAVVYNGGSETLYQILVFKPVGRGAEKEVLDILKDFTFTPSP